VTSDLCSQGMPPPIQSLYRTQLDYEFKKKEIKDDIVHFISKETEEKKKIY
jgi:hypothetical protein